MSEIPQPSKLAFVREQIKDKAWYGLDSATGAFNWQKSVANLASVFSLQPDQVDAAITNAFTPACLTKVDIANNGKEIHTPLLEAIKELQIKPYIWTVGDIDWQRTKFERSGASHYVPNEQYYCAAQNKIESLKSIIERIVTSNSPQTEIRRIIVVDDKPTNVDGVARLAEEYKDKNIQIGNYHLKSQDSQANATAFYQWFISEMKKSNGQKFDLILDFDGVIADTDGVLFGPASENIASLLK